MEDTDSTLLSMMFQMMSKRIDPTKRIDPAKSRELKRAQEAQERYINELLTLKFDPTQPDASVYQAVNAQRYFPTSYPLRLLSPSSNVAGPASATDITIPDDPNDRAAMDIVILSVPGYYIKDQAVPDDYQERIDKIDHILEIQRIFYRTVETLPQGLPEYVLQLGQLAVEYNRPDAGEWMEWNTGKAWQPLPFTVMLDVIHKDKPLWLIHDRELHMMDDNMEGEDAWWWKRFQENHSGLDNLYSFFRDTLDREKVDMAQIVPRVDLWKDLSWKEMQDNIRQSARKVGPKIGPAWRGNFKSAESSEAVVSIIAPKKVSVTIKYSKPGTLPPIYLAGSFSDPAWQPQEMLYTTTTDNGHEFHKEVHVEEGHEYQYKFRIGEGDWWILNEDSPTITDDAGNRNNLLSIPRIKETSEQKADEQPKVPTVTTESPNHTRTL